MSENHMLTADEILAADDIEEKVIDVPEWNGQVTIRALNLRQIANIAQKSIKRNAAGQDETSREVSVIMTLAEGMIDPKLTPDQAKKMATKSASAVTRIVQAINALGPTQAAVEDADKSVWDESDAPIPIRFSPGIGDDVGQARNGDG